MKNIIYYVTDHGSGHATRTVAICRELQKNKINLIIRNSNNIKFFKNSLPKIKVISGITDVGPVIKENGFSIDKNESIKKLDKWFEEFFHISLKETKKIREFKPELIISDISPMPFLVSEKLKIPSIAISNFTWYDSLDFITKDQKKILFDSYRLADLAIKLPFGTKMNHFRKIKKCGIVSRKPNLTKMKIKERIAVGRNEKFIFIDIGNGKKSIRIKNDSSVHMITTKTILKTKNWKKLATWEEGQNLVSASNLVICKLGYGMITECLTNQIPFWYISDDNHIEQQEMHKQLKKMKLGKRVFEEDFAKITIESKLFEKVKIPKKLTNNTKQAKNMILQFLKR